MCKRLWVGIGRASGTLAGDAHAQFSSEVPDGCHAIASRRVPGPTALEALDRVEFAVRPVAHRGR